MIITDELCFFIFAHSHPISRLPLCIGPRALLLFFHLFSETWLIHLDPALARNQRGEIEWKAVSVIELKGLRAADRFIFGLRLNEINSLESFLERSQEGSLLLENPPRRDFRA